MKNQPEEWHFISWFIIIFVVLVFVVYTMRPSFLLEKCEHKETGETGETEDHFECDHCEVHPSLAVYFCIVISAILVLSARFIAFTR